MNFRRELESGKQIFFREFESTSDWEEMFREHLVAYLDGLKRSSLDSNFQNMDAENALLLGRFYGEGVSQAGARLELQVDLDGDEHDETVKFWYSHGGYGLSITKFDKILYLPLPSGLSEEHSIHFHLAIKDVTNDGLPEILLAFSDGPGSLSVGIWGFTEQARGSKSRDLTQQNFSLIEELKSQYQARVLDGGTILLPYGSVGCKTACRWDGTSFVKTDE